MPLFVLQFLQLDQSNQYFSDHVQRHTQMTHSWSDFPDDFPYIVIAVVRSCHTPRGQYWPNKSFRRTCSKALPQYTRYIAINIRPDNYWQQCVPRSTRHDLPYRYYTG